MFRIGAGFDPFEHLLASGRRMVGAADAVTDADADTDLVVAVPELSRQVGQLEGVPVVVALPHFLVRRRRRRRCRRRRRRWSR